MSFPDNNFESWVDQFRRDAALAASETATEHAERLLREVSEDLRDGFQSAEAVTAARAKLDTVLEMGTSLPRELHLHAETLKHDLDERYPDSAS